MNDRSVFDPTSHYAIRQLHPPADTAHIRRKYLDIPYAARSAAQKLDIYLPEGAPDRFP